jgi:predicted ArsR family transcriptional regulator
LVLLCGGRRTVKELASKLQLTDNAVRAQLERLVRDGLAQPAGSRRGVRKPHVDYELTEKARRLFPTAYEPVLGELLNALAQKLAAEDVSRLLIATFEQWARRSIGTIAAREPRQRMAAIIKKIDPYAPGITVEATPGNAVIRSCSCPLASLTAKHADLCQSVAVTLGKLLNAPVVERCERTEWPRCCFEVILADSPTSATKR